MDNLTKDERSRMMSRIRGKDTKPEMAVRSLLHRLGYRFRLHRPDLPGTPDIVLPGRRTVVVVHGCFWHRHAGCRESTVPKTNTDFWVKKLNGNVERDQRNTTALEALGWKTVVVWGCETKDLAALSNRLCKLIDQGREL